MASEASPPFPRPGSPGLPRSGTARGRGSGARAASIALGATLAPTGTMVKIALAVAGLTALGAVIAAVVFAARGASGALADLAPACASALAWGAGILVAIPASLQAFREDRAKGIRALLRSRGASTRTYAEGRILGLALALFAVVGGGTLVGGGAAFLLASKLGVAAHALGALVASLAYAAAFAIVIAPMTLAALGGRSRGVGYLWLVVFLFLPELAEPWTGGIAPAGWRDVLSVPSALVALRNGVTPSSVDVAEVARALVVLAAFAAFSFVFVLTEIARVDGEQAGEDATP